MILNDVDYPDLLVDAIKNDRLVLFAGAGVSMGEPTNLPSFNNLSKRISQLTNVPKGETEPDEQYLGRIKNLGHNVHKEVCSILNESNLLPNKYHNTVINFFDKDNIRIVTTNYDLMFEKTIDQKGEKVNVFSYPALPYGNEFKGIIHLHGEVNDSSNIVLTDADFGKSYMYHGNVTSFLRALFESNYVVLFVGYSFGDIVMKYFTRALPDLSGKKRFIFASEDQVEDYKSLGLTPIIYRKDDFDQVYDSLSDLSKLLIRDDNKWNLRIIAIAAEKPNKLSDEFNYEVKEILSNIHYADKLFELIKGKYWAEYLFDMGYFDDIFSEIQLNDFSFKKIEWLSNNIIIDEIELFIKFCFEKELVLNNSLQYEIANLICKQNIEIDKINKLINLIDFNKIGYYLLNKLLDVCIEYSPLLDLKASQIISESLSFDLKKDTFINCNRLKIDFKFNNYQIISLWEKFKLFNNKNYLNVLDSISSQLNGLERFQAIGISVDNFIFSSFYKDESDYINEHDTFMNIFAKLLFGLRENQKKHWFRKYISSNITLLVRSAMFVLREISDISAREKLQVLKSENIRILDIDYKEDLFMLYSEIFPKLNDKEKNIFLNDLMSEEKLNKNYTDETYYYQKYNLLVWLNRFDEQNQAINKYKNEILEIYSYFKPRENPPKSVGPITIRWGDGPLPYSENEIIYNLENLFFEFLYYSGDGFKQAERNTLINTLEKISTANPEFRDRLIDLLLFNNEFESDLWDSVIKSFDKPDISENEFIEIFEKIFIQPIIEANSFEFSSVIYSNLKNRGSISDYFLNFLYEKIKLLWPYARDVENDSIDYMTKALNSSKGYIALSMIHIIDISSKNKDCRILENRFKEFLEKMLYEEGFNDTFVVIFGNASFFYSLDKNWFNEHILDKFNSSDSKLLNVIWNGFIYQSYLYPEFALTMEEKFHEAVRKINIFEDENLQKGILKRYVSLMVNIADDPINDYVPNVFKRETSNKIIDIFYFELSRYLKSLDKKGRNEILDKWILTFLSNRTRNLPTQLTSYEKNLILKLLLEFPDKVEQLNDIFISIDEHFNVEQGTLNYLFYSIEVTNKNSEMINKILISITNQMRRNTKEIIPLYIQSEIKNIFEKILGMGVDTGKLERNMKFLNILK